MADAVVEQIVEDTQKLTHTVSEEESTERLFMLRLLAKGMLTHIPEPDPSYEARRHPPIVVEGEPVSETIIRERR